MEFTFEQQIYELYANSNTFITLENTHCLLEYTFLCKIASTSGSHSSIQFRTNQIGTYHANVFVEPAASHICPRIIYVKHLMSQYCELAVYATVKRHLNFGREKRFYSGEKIDICQAECVMLLPFLPSIRPQFPLQIETYWFQSFIIKGRVSIIKPTPCVGLPVCVSICPSIKFFYNEHVLYLLYLLILSIVEWICNYFYEHHFR